MSSVRGETMIRHISFRVTRQDIERLELLQQLLPRTDPNKPPSISECIRWALWVAEKIALQNFGRKGGEGK